MHFYYISCGNNHVWIRFIAVSSFLCVEAKLDLIWHEASPLVEQEPIKVPKKIQFRNNKPKVFQGNIFGRWPYSSWLNTLFVTKQTPPKKYARKLRQIFLQLPVCAHSRYVWVRFVIRLLKRPPASCVCGRYADMKRGPPLFCACVRNYDRDYGEKALLFSPGKKLNYSRKKVREEDASSFPVSAFFSGQKKSFATSTLA